MCREKTKKIVLADRRRTKKHLDEELKECGITVSTRIIGKVLHNDGLLSRRPRKKNKKLQKMFAVAKDLKNWAVCD